MSRQRTLEKNERNEKNEKNKKKEIICEKDEEKDEKDEEKEYTCDEYREKGLKALRTVVKVEANIKILEKNIYQISDNDEELYIKIIYQSVGDICAGRPIKEVLDNVKKKFIGRDHQCFNEIKRQISERDEFILHPFEVEEGVTKCGKCKSNRTYTYQRQCRGSDEPMTTFAKCLECGDKWTYSG